MHKVFSKAISFSSRMDPDLIPLVFPLPWRYKDVLMLIFSPPTLNDAQHVCTCTKEILQDQQPSRRNPMSHVSMNGDDA